VITRPPRTVAPEPAPAVDVPEPLTEPRRDWDDDPRTCARYDRAYFDRDDHDDEEGSSDD
jgi:hypothetical protein